MVIDNIAPADSFLSLRQVLFLGEVPQEPTQANLMIDRLNGPLYKFKQGVQEGLIQHQIKVLLIRLPGFLECLPLIVLDKLCVKGQPGRVEKLAIELEVVLVEEGILLLLGEFLQTDFEGFHHSLLAILYPFVVDLLQRNLRRLQDFLDILNLNHFLGNQVCDQLDQTGIWNLSMPFVNFIQ